MDKSNNTVETLWWKSGVIYQIYPRSFKDSDGDGIGDLVGIIDELDYLSDILGVDALWLSPIFPSPMADFGYDISNYVDIDSIFGDLNTFDKLVEQAHKRALKIIVDYVPNHTSDEHPWFIESRMSRTNSKRDWYVWADSKPDGTPPNNWLSVFGSSAWQWNADTGQYYLHSFLKEQPDLNWRNPEVKAAMLDTLRFWLERGVDGFRIDAAHFIMKDPAMRDLPPNLAKEISARDYDTLLHTYDFAHEDVHAVYQDIRQVLESYSAEQPRFSVGEIDLRNWQQWASYYGAKLDELHMPFNFALISARWQPSVVREIIDAIEASVPSEGWPNYVLGNHDQSRIASRVGPAQARVAMMMLLTLRGTPTMYYGDEIGMHNVNIPAEQIQDPFGKSVPRLGRDPERTPMQWDSSPNAGFASAHSNPWLPLADDYQQINVEGQRDDPSSMLSLTRKLLALRKRIRALNAGGYLSIDGMPDSCLAYVRQLGKKRYLIALNF